MILVLVGESASGKSTIEKIFHERNPTFNKVVSYTTRPARDGEREGVDYHFVTVETFEQMRKEGAFIETAQYRDWLYGSAKSDYIVEGNVIAVLTPHGCRSLKRWAKEAGISVYSVYVKVDRRSRLIRNLYRGDNIEEAYRRSLSDVGQFDGFADEADYIIENEHYEKTIEEVYKEFALIHHQIELQEDALKTYREILGSFEEQEVIP